MSDPRIMHLDDLVDDVLLGIMLKLDMKDANSFLQTSTKYYKFRRKLTLAYNDLENADNPISHLVGGEPIESARSLCAQYLSIQFASSYLPHIRRFYPSSTAKLDFINLLNKPIFQNMNVTSVWEWSLAKVFLNLGYHYPKRDNRIKFNDGTLFVAKGIVDIVSKFMEAFERASSPQQPYNYYEQLLSLSKAHESADKAHFEQNKWMYSFLWDNLLCKHIVNHENKPLIMPSQFNAQAEELVAKSAQKAKSLKLTYPHFSVIFGDNVNTALQSALLTDIRTIAYIVGAITRLPLRVLNDFKDLYSYSRIRAFETPDLVRLSHDLMMVESIVNCLGDQYNSHLAKALVHFNRFYLLNNVHQLDFLAGLLKKHHIEMDAYHIAALISFILSNSVSNETLEKKLFLLVDSIKKAKETDVYVNVIAMFERQPPDISFLGEMINFDLNYQYTAIWQYITAKPIKNTFRRDTNFLTIIAEVSSADRQDPTPELLDLIFKISSDFNFSDIIIPCYSELFASRSNITWALKHQKLLFSARSNFYIQSTTGYLNNVLIQILFHYPQARERLATLKKYPFLKNKNHRKMEVNNLLRNPITDLDVMLVLPNNLYNAALNFLKQNSFMQEAIMSAFGSCLATYHDRLMFSEVCNFTELNNFLDELSSRDLAVLTESKKEITGVLDKVLNVYAVITIYYRKEAQLFFEFLTTFISCKDRIKAHEQLNSLYQQFDTLLNCDPSKSDLTSFELPDLHLDTLLKEKISSLRGAQVITDTKKRPLEAQEEQGREAAKRQRRDETPAATSSGTGLFAQLAPVNPTVPEDPMDVEEKEAKPH